MFSKSDVNYECLYLTNIVYVKMKSYHLSKFIHFTDVNHNLFITSNYTLLYGDHSPETNDQQFCHLQFLPISYKTDDANLKFIRF